MGKRPRDAYTDMISSVPKKFKSSAAQYDVIVNLPSYDEVRCQLSRHRTHSCIPVTEVLSIPDALKRTLRGRAAADDDPPKDNLFCCTVDKKVKNWIRCNVCPFAVSVQPTHSTPSFFCNPSLSLFCLSRWKSCQSYANIAWSICDIQTQLNCVLQWLTSSYILLRYYCIDLFTCKMLL